MQKLESVFFYHLEKAIKAYRQHAQANFRAHGFSITIDQWLILKTIADHREISQQELAGAVFKDKASITRMVELLLHKELIARTLFQEARKRHKLVLTPKGQKLVRDVEPAVKENRHTALQHTDPGDLLAAERVLRALVINCQRSRQYPPEE